jgi:hypothetical protein
MKDRHVDIAIGSELVGPKKAWSLVTRCSYKFLCTTLNPLLDFKVTGGTANTA